MKNLRSSIILFFNIICILLTANGYSQPITWQRTYQGPSIIDSGYQICSAPGGDFYFVGYSSTPNHVFVMKINRYGDEVWSKLDTSAFSHNFTSRCCTSTPDGGCIISGHGNIMYSIKLDSGGNFVWKKSYDNIQGGQIVCNKIIAISDGGYFGAGGFITSYYGENGWDMKLDSNGNFVWSSIFGDSRRVYTGAVEGINFGYVIAGLYQRTDTPIASIVQESNPPNGFWNDSNCNSPSVFVSIERSNSAYYVCGNYRETSNKYHAFLAKIDMKGYAEFVQEYPAPFSEKALDIKMLNPNRFVISILHDSANGQIQCGKVIITDSNGVILQNKIFPARKYLSLNSILPLGNDGIIFAGTYDYSTYWPEHGTDFYAVRTDSLLNFPDLLPPIEIQPIGNYVPNTFKLYQNFPNPFNPSTKIKFDLPKDANVTIEIYDMLGKVVSLLAKNEFRKAGSYQIDWNAGSFASGVYVYRIQAGSFLQCKKMVLIK
jgi:hypothetical protein